MQDHSSKFNVVTQLSEKALVRIIRALQTSQDFPSRWQGRKRLTAAALGIELSFSYDVKLGEPELRAESGNAGKLALVFDFQGVLQLDAEIRLRPPVNASSHNVSVRFHGSVEAQVPLMLARIGTYGYLELATRELRTVALQVEYDGDIGGNAPIFNRMVQRILLANLVELGSIPISHGFEMETTGGSAVTNYTLRVIDGPSPPDRDDVTIALNTWPNRYCGSRAGLHDWVNPGFDLAICYDERFLVQAVTWALSDDRVPKEYDESGCPEPRGPVRVRDIALNLGDGYLDVFIDATCNGGNFDARGRVTLFVEPRNTLGLAVACDQGSGEFLTGVSTMLARSILALAGLETFADAAEPDRPSACRARIMPPALCGTPISLVLNASIPRTKVRLAYEIDRIDITRNEMSTRGGIAIK